MLTSRRRFEGTSLLIFLLVIGLFTLAACSPASSAESAEDNMDEMVADEMEGMDHHHMSDGDEGVSNDGQGVTIRLISPEDGATYFVDERIPVEVEVEGFALGKEGGHWHVFVGGTVWGMTSGSEKQQTLLGLEPGMREIAVSLAGGDHLDLEASDSVTIMIEQRSK